jgi:hypothetical protein
MAIPRTPELTSHLYFHVILSHYDDYLRAWLAARLNGESRESTHRYNYGQEIGLLGKF